MMSDLMMFLEGDTSFEGNIITENDTFSLGGDGNNTLNILSSVREDVAFYYVPSFTLAGSNTEQVTAETLLYGELARLMLFIADVEGVSIFIVHLIAVINIFIGRFIIPITHKLFPFTADYSIAAGHSWLIKTNVSVSKKQ